MDQLKNLSSPLEWLKQTVPKERADGLSEGVSDGFLVDVLLDFCGWSEF